VTVAEPRASLTSVARSLYIASPEAQSGKSVVALGVLHEMTRRMDRVGVFRPVIRSDQGGDVLLELLLANDGVDLPYERCIGVTYDDVHADPDAALSEIIARYRSVERDCGAVVIVGSDYTDVGAPTELEFNARIAANLGASVLLVVNGHRRSPANVRSAIDIAGNELTANHAGLLGVVVNRVAPDKVDDTRSGIGDVGVPVYVLPDEPLLGAPTFRQLQAACEGELFSGDEELLDREVLSLAVAGMTLPNLLDRLVEGSVVITPGDRSDVLVGLLMAHESETFPTLAGVVLNGGFTPPPQIVRLIDGLDIRLPIVLTQFGTYETATRLSSVRGHLSNTTTRKIDTALTLFEKHVDGADLMDRIDVARTDVVTPLMFEFELLDRARRQRRHIVLPEGTEERILRAADTLLRREVASLTLLGDEGQIRTTAAQLAVDLDNADIIDPRSSPLSEQFAGEYARLRAHKGVTADMARDVVRDVSYFGTMMVQMGLADGMVSGAVHTTAHTIRPAFEVVKTKPGMSIVSSVFFMCLPDRVLVYGDCAVNPDPDAAQLADIALSSAETAAQFGVEPRVAMLSYSTGESGTGAEVEKVRQATALVRERRPDLSVEGPIQYDAAVDASVARTKLPSSLVAGRATVFVFPDLNTGNNTYKAVQRSAGAIAIGPVLQGLRKPVNDLSRGALVRDIVNTVAITAIQAQK
jgi:phosphate acetyltransferase